MGLLDFYSLIDISSLNGSGGQFNVTKGASWNAVYGSSCGHVVGSKMRLTVDPIEFLRSLYKASKPGMTDAASGIGGNCSFVYGSSTQVLYGGPNITIQRARAIEKRSDYFWLPRKTTEGLPPPDPLEPTASTTVKVLSALINLVPSAMEAALYFFYRDYNPIYDEDIKTLPEMLKLLANAITTRLMAVVRAIESATVLAQIAEKLAAETAERVKDVAAGFAACRPYEDSNRKESNCSIEMVDLSVRNAKQAQAVLANGKAG